MRATTTSPQNKHLKSMRCIMGAHASSADEVRSQHDESAFSFFSEAKPLSVTVEDHDRSGYNIEKAEKKIAIILGYYNGEAHVDEQLESIFSQSHSALHVFIGDDHSPSPFDADVLKIEFKKRLKLSVETRSENVGFAKNFLQSLACIDDSFEYFAFSDQDDIWYPNKLKKAIEELTKAPAHLPALYCARTEIADADCSQILGCSPIFNKPPSFANALVQNIGGGNTMVFNKAARDLIVAASRNTTVVSHDWWCYQIVTGAGGYVFYDSEPCLKYRQHSNNLVGANTSWSARLLRIRALMEGRFRAWNDVNLKALADHKHLLTDQNIRILNDFIGARQSSLFKRLKLVKHSGIYRQTLFGNLGLLFGLLLNRI